jgi:predicted dehydrogenase
VHVLLEKPMTQTVEEADELVSLANQNGCILQVGHLERFNPAFQAIAPQIQNPMFIEAHRMALFNERGLEVDVILDLMIHDIDIVLHIVKAPLRRIRAAGIPVMTDLPDIANVRLEFENGAIANLTASRISVKMKRRLRIFQEDFYLVADYASKRAYRFSRENGSDDRGFAEIAVDELEIEEKDALEEEILSFLLAVRNHGKPVVDAHQGRQALAVALNISQQIKEKLGLWERTREQNDKLKVMG